MPEFSALILYTHKNGHFSHVLTIEARSVDRAQRIATHTARRMHKMHGHFVLTMWEGDTFLFCSRLPACIEPENQATQAKKEECHAIPRRQDPLARS